MLMLLLPLTAICIAVIGFYVWHRQLIAKRRFDVADTALVAFGRAEAALAYARAPMTFIGEGSSINREQGELPGHSELLDRFFIPFERLRRHNEAFEELERVAFAVEIHFGDEVASCVREPLRAYSRIATATACRMELVGAPYSAARQKLFRMQAVIYPVGWDSDVAARPVWP